MSAICEAFGCTPREAERQNPELVRRVFEVRNAQYAVKLMDEHSDDLAKHPGLGMLLQKMHRAMNGEEIDD